MTDTIPPDCHGGEYPDRVDICQCRHCGALHPNQIAQEDQ